MEQLGEVESGNLRSSPSCWSSSARLLASPLASPLSSAVPALACIPVSLACRSTSAARLSLRCSPYQTLAACVAISLSLPSACCACPTATRPGSVDSPCPERPTFPSARPPDFRAPTRRLASIALHPRTGGPASRIGPRPAASSLDPLLALFLSLPLSHLH